MPVNPYQSPADDPIDGSDDEQPPRTVSEFARIGSLAGAVAGATYGAAVGAAIGFACVAWSFFSAPDFLPMLAKQFFVFGIGTAIVGTLYGIFNGAVIGMLDGILLARFQESFNRWLTVVNVLGFGWASGYEAFMQTITAMTFLANQANSSAMLGITPVLIGTLIGVVGGIFTAMALIRTLGNVLPIPPAR